MSNWPFYERHFSAARLRHYLAEASGDETQAAELYRWNVAVSGAFWESLAYFEVAFRNVIDARLTQRHEELARTGHWIFDDSGELGRSMTRGTSHKQPYRDIAEAIGRVRKSRKPIDSGQIISELPFGFWHQLVSRRQLFLWPEIASGFPHAPSRAQEHVHEPTGRIRVARNRIGHHHRVWSEDIIGRNADLMTLAGYIDPQLATFIKSRSRVERLLEHRPEVSRG